MGDASAAAPGGESVRIPGWLPPAVYALLTLFLFRAFVFSDDMLRGGDTESLGYVARKFFADALGDGVFPRWNPLILGGTPFIESLAGGDSLYPTSLLLLLMEPYRALGWKLVLHVFASGLFMFGWIRSLGCTRAAAFVAGGAYVVAPFLVSFVAPGHDGKLFVTALAPLLFWAAERTLRKPGFLPYAGVSLVVALVLFTTHFQMAYFVFGAAGAYYLFRASQIWRGVDVPPDGVEPGETRIGRGPKVAAGRVAAFVGAALLGAALAGVQLIPAVDYVTEYSRRTATTVGATAEENLEYSSSFSLHPEDVVGYLIPEFSGNEGRGAAWATGTYWGRNVFKDNHQYAGLVVLLLAGAAFLGGPRRGVRFFLLGLGGVALLYALGRHTPIWRIFYEVFPGVSLFRAPDMASVLFGFSLVTLSAFGVDRVLGLAAGGRDTDSDAALGRYFWITAAGGFLLLLLAASGALLAAWTSLLRPDLEAYSAQALERARPFITRGAAVAALLAAATATTAWAGHRGLLRPLGVAALLTLLTAVDGLRIDSAFIKTMDFGAFTAADPNIDFLVAQTQPGEPFRLASLQRAGQDVTPAMFGIELATGHHPNDLARYRELTGMRGSGLPENFFQGTDILRNPVMRVLNVRYLALPADVGEIPGAEPVSATQLGGRVYERIYEVEGLPRARLVSDAVVLPDEQAVARILDPAFDPATTAVLAEPPPIELPGGAAVGEVTWLERGINEMSLRVRSDGPALLILADNWFPSWRARVNGEEAPVLRAYHTLRAVPVGAGDHTVELYYESPLLRTSLAVSSAALALLLALAILSLVRSRRGAAGPDPA